MRVSEHKVSPWYGSKATCSIPTFLLNFYNFAQFLQFQHICSEIYLVALEFGLSRLREPSTIAIVASDELGGSLSTTLWGFWTAIYSGLLYYHPEHCYFFALILLWHIHVICVCILQCAPDFPTSDFEELSLKSTQSFQNPIRYVENVQKVGKVVGIRWYGLPWLTYMPSSNRSAPFLPAFLRIQHPIPKK